MRQTLMGLCGLAVITLSTGCPLLKVEADFDAVHVTYKNLTVPGVPAEAGGHITRSFVADDLAAVEGFNDVIDIGGSLELVSAELRAASGVADFAFVQRVNVNVGSGDPASALPMAPFFTCEGNCAPIGDALTIPPTAQANALAYLKTGSLLVDVEVDGVLPVADWSVDIDLTFQGHIEGTYAP